MPGIENRVAYLEGRVEEHSRRIDDVREALVSLERRVESLEHRMDARFENVEHRLDGLDEKMTRYFVWVVGMHVTTLAAVVAAFAGRG